MSKFQQAKVKSVLSGDTLVLTSLNNPTSERTLSLAFVSSPRLRRDGDEVSRIFLISLRTILLRVDGECIAKWRVQC